VGGLISWIALGLVAGVLARIVVPGRQTIGCLATLAVGIAGALIGGFVAEAVLDENVDLGFDLKSLAIATVFSVVLLLALEALAGRRGQP
jgi:uncharacterized membrane protein YeaQ/YmgE (transglycosylase-associated protein family)